MIVGAIPAPIGVRVSGTVLAASTLELDANALTNFSMLRYFLAAKAGTTAKSMDISVVNQDGVLSDSIFGRVGTPLSLQVALIVLGSDAVLRITNPNAFNVDVEAIRLIVA